VADAGIDQQSLDATTQIGGFWKLKLTNCAPIFGLRKSAYALATARTRARPDHNSGYLLFDCYFNGANWPLGETLPPIRRRGANLRPSFLTEQFPIHE
jgi:hypothetical protein